MYVPAEHKRSPVIFAPSATGGGAANTTRSGMMISSGMNSGGVSPSNNDGMVFSIAAPNNCTSPERETTTSASKRGRDGSPARYHCEPTLSPHPGAIQLHYPQQGQLQQQVSTVMPTAVSMAETTTAAALPPNAAPPKRTRTNEYRPPRKVPSSFTSQVGSLAVGHHVMMMGNNNNNNNHASSARTTTREQQQQQQLAGRAVGLRRQLSSSKIEAFLSSGDDAMDVDVEQGRPRSMSL